MMNAKTTMMRKEFALLREVLPVRYKFLSKRLGGPIRDEIFEGTSSDLNTVGMRLEGRIPDLSWTVDLLTRQIYLGVNILLPGSDEPIKALARVLWVEAWSSELVPTGIGLKFRDMETADRLRLSDVVGRIRKPGASTRIGPFDMGGG